YTVSGNYSEITDAPKNPDLIIARYSSLAYVYHILKKNVFFVNIDFVNADFMSDASVNKISLSQLTDTEYLKKYVQE
ncbi:hypothetical protein, partial [Enterobacter hormaechei]|uniref:hypothetical protein n=1 Tax=Enterobacter hormaechei TaxID=158836 RepID=UPI003D6FF8F4